MVFDYECNTKKLNHLPPTIKTNTIATITPIEIPPGEEDPPGCKAYGAGGGGTGTGGRQNVRAKETAKEISTTN